MINYSLSDMEVAEIHWHDLLAEAECERLAREALKLRRKRKGHSRLERYLDALRGRDRDGTPVDPQKN